MIELLDQRQLLLYVLPLTFVYTRLLFIKTWEITVVFCFDYFGFFEQNEFVILLHSERLIIFNILA